MPNLSYLVKAFERYKRHVRLPHLWLTPHGRFFRLNLSEGWNTRPDSLQNHSKLAIDSS